MKIGNTGASPAMGTAGGVASTPRETAETAKAGTSSVPGTGKDGSTTVKISSAASELLGGTEGSFDAEKVARVRQSISDGTYQVNPEAIADKLISNAQDLLGKIGSAG